MTDLAAFIAARMSEDDERAADRESVWPAVSFGIAEPESSISGWDVREYRNGFLHRTVASSLPKREAQLLRDKCIAALHSDHPDYRQEWAL